MTETVRGKVGSSLGSNINAVSTERRLAEDGRDQVISWELNSITAGSGHREQGHKRLRIKRT